MHDKTIATRIESNLLADDWTDTLGGDSVLLDKGRFGLVSMSDESVDDDSKSVEEMGRPLEPPPPDRPAPTPALGPSV